MRKDREPKVKIPTQLDVELAVDGDVNNIFENCGRYFESPRKRITIREAWLAQSRPLDIDETPETSNN
jgi:hypothetical protein